MKQNIRNIEFWKEFKNGDVIELDVNGKTNNVFNPFDSEYDLLIC